LHVLSPKLSKAWRARQAFFHKLGDCLFARSVIADVAPRRWVRQCKSRPLNGFGAKPGT
jgi:hypothetical protein